LGGQSKESDQDSNVGHEGATSDNRENGKIQDRQWLISLTSLPGSQPVAEPSSHNAGKSHVLKKEPLNHSKIS
jgi:hypothetical protein